MRDANGRRTKGQGGREGGRGGGPWTNPPQGRISGGVVRAAASPGHGRRRERQQPAWISTKERRWYKMGRTGSGRRGGGGKGRPRKRGGGGGGGREPSIPNRPPVSSAGSRRNEQSRGAQETRRRVCSPTALFVNHLLLGNGNICMMMANTGGAHARIKSENFCARYSSPGPLHLANVALWIGRASHYDSALLL